jgi:hypothetical protein
MVIVAEQLCCTLDKQERKGLNEVHGQIMTLEAFLTHRQSNDECIVALTKFESRFSSGAALDGWPTLISNSLATLVDNLQKSSASPRKEEVTGTSLSKVDLSNIVQLLGNGVSSRSLDTLLVLLTGEVSFNSSLTNTDLCRRLCHTYTSTLNEPLKNVLLPIISRIAVSFHLLHMLPATHPGCLLYSPHYLMPV